jgi:hypothetical protein
VGSNASLPLQFDFCQPQKREYGLLCRVLCPPPVRDSTPDAKDDPHPTSFDGQLEDRCALAGEEILKFPRKELMTHILRCGSHAMFKTDLSVFFCSKNQFDLLLTDDSA